MKANELMIGDLVRVNRDGLCIKKDTAVRVMGIDGESRLKEKGLVGCAGCRPLDKKQFDGGIWLDYLDPIPLTPEILEKNGFIWTGGGDSTKMFSTPWGYDGIRYNLYVGLKKKTIEVHAAHPELRSESWRKVNKVSLEVCGCYVHELQHALRLCGIEKEVVL